MEDKIIEDIKTYLYTIVCRNVDTGKGNIYNIYLNFRRETRRFD